MAVSTAGTFLEYDPTKLGVYVSLLDIINYPDLGSTPTKIDTTDLSAMKFKTSILGLQETPDLTFEANFDADVYDTISALTGEYPFRILFGTAGVDGAFGWTGNIAIYVMGGGVDEARKMQVTLSASTPIAPVTVV